MKPKLFLLILASTSILFSGCAKHFMEDWSKEDTARQLAFTGLLAIDLGVQTPRFLREDRELNPAISENNLPIYSVICAGGHFVISGLLSPEWRKGWQTGWIGAETVTIIRNETVR